MPFKPLYKITDRIASDLTKIERARGFLDAAKLKEEWLKGMQRLKNPALSPPFVTPCCRS